MTPDESLAMARKRAQRILGAVLLVILALVSLSECKGCDDGPWDTGTIRAVSR